MDVEAKIQSLLELAEPLRRLHDDDPEKARLAQIIDQINVLRKEQETAVHLGQPAMENPRTGPTSTRVIDANAVVEGADAAIGSIEAMAESERVAHQEQAVVAVRRKPGPKPGPRKAKP